MSKVVVAAAAAALVHCGSGVGWSLGGRKENTTKQQQHFGVSIRSAGIVVNVLRNVYWRTTPQCVCVSFFL